MGNKKPIVTAESARAFRERLDEAAKRYGEIKPDNANWYQRNIVRPFTTWINTRPGGPMIAVLKATSSFVPGVGEAIDIAEGDPAWAAVGALPLVGDAVQAGRRIVKSASNAIDVAQAADNLRHYKRPKAVKRAIDYISDHDAFAGPEDWGIIDEIRRSDTNIDPNSIPFKRGGKISQNVGYKKCK